MKITDSRIYEGRGRVLANINITLDGILAINGIKVVEGKNGKFCSYPQTSYKDKDGETRYRDIVFPCTSKARAGLDKAILDLYDKWTTETDEEVPF